MRYILLIYDNELDFAKMPEQEVTGIMSDYRNLSIALQEAGVYVAGNRLRSIDTAKSVQVRNGRTLTTDGPFAETKEQLGGFYMINVKDIDEALHWAAKIPSARFGTIEVRPIWE